MPRSFLPLSALALMASAIVVGAVSAPAPPRTFLEAHCYDCHDDSVQKGDLNLLDLEFAPGEPGSFKLWERVFDRVEAGEMPPKKKPRPEAGEKARFLGKLEASLLEADRADAASMGRVKVRRLTRREYEHTVHDLLGIDIPLQEWLPEDPLTHGFETVAEGQQLSHFNLARYLDVADLALDEALGRALGGEKSYERSFPAKELGQNGPQSGNFRGPETRGDESIAWPIRIQFYGRMPATRVRESGWYRITLKDVRAINAETGSVWGTLRSGACASNEPMLYPIGLVEATEEPRDLTFEAWIRGDHILDLKPDDNTRKSAPTGADGGNVGYRGRDLEKQGFEGIALTAIRMERIYPNAERWEVRRNLLGANAKDGGEGLWKQPKTEESEALLKETIRAFAGRAFRRPVTAAEVAPYVALALDEAGGEGKRLADGLRVAYQAVLCSPRFLTFVEEPGPLDDHAVASRLSYMLWNSMPDAELRALADKGKLRDPKTLHAQIDRLLESPKSDRFIASFTDQWLNLKDIEFTSPDRRLYPTFDPVVQDSMVAETRAFVRELVGADRRITDIVQSDFAMLNERLARFYGMDEVRLEPGAGLQKVSLAKNARGGLITQGAVLKVSANGTTTSPVVRGVWVSERILGLEIPPPPADVPAVEPDVRGAVSIRDQLDKHRNSESCASCHVKIDPAGFALESFDPVGRWRTRYGSKKSSARVDPSGITPEGATFAGIHEWKQIYLERPAQITSGFARQLLTYATGAPMRFSDRPALREIVRQAGEGGYGTKAILHFAVASEIFLNK